VGHDRHDGFGAPSQKVANELAHLVALHYGGCVDVARSGPALGTQRRRVEQCRIPGLNSQLLTLLLQFPNDGFDRPRDVLGQYLLLSGRGPAKRADDSTKFTEIVVDKNRLLREGKDRRLVAE
jgi:hypothetical protein